MNNPRFSIEYYINYARSLGGKCLSKHYHRQDSKLIFICAKRHKFSLTPEKIFRRRQWCGDCTGYRHHTTASLRKLVKEKVGKLLSEYTGLKERVEIQCANGHHWHPRAINVIHGDYWCPDCGKYKLELFTREIFEKLTGKQFTKVFPDWLRYHEKRLQLDGYCEELNLAFEHQGQQHYHFVRFFQRNKKGFALLKARDRFKLRKCKSKGIKLICVDDAIAPKDLADYIISELTLNKIPFDSQKKSEINFRKWGSPDRKSKWKALIEKRGNTLISKTHAHHREEFRVRCGKCHKPYQTTEQKLRDGCGCPNCNPYRNNTLEDLHELAKKKCLRYLSPKVIPCEKPAPWICLKCGRKFTKKPTLVTQGYGCTCTLKIAPLTVKDLQSDAQKIGLTLAERKYLGHTIKHRYNCPRHGTIKILPSSVRHGHGCVKCRYIRILEVNGNKFEVKSQTWNKKIQDIFRQGITEGKKNLSVNGKRYKLIYSLKKQGHC